MDNLHYISIALDVFGILATLVVIMCLLIGENRKYRLNRLFVHVAACNVGILLSDLLSWMVNGNIERYAVILNRISAFMLYFFGIMIVAAFTHYFMAYIEERGKALKWIAYLIYALSAIQFVMLVISQFTGIYYYIDESNIYHRNHDTYWVSQIEVYLSMALNITIIFVHRKFLNAREIFFLAFYMMVPLIFNIIHILYYGISFVNMGTTLAMLIIYAGIQSEQAKRLKEKELEVAENRIAIMLSQIQPHFLYNTLVTIHQLCDVNKEDAKKAIEEFSAYLRMNLDSLQRKEPILFRQELKHVENYLELEKKRFGERIRVDYDIGFTDFKIPALTVQPIVENAVRYGITRKVEGGCIMISSRLEEGYAVITIIDDGVGFEIEPGAKVKEGRSHVGIENVRNRLIMLCGGSLDINSVVGEGTQAVIKIKV